MVHQIQSLVRLSDGTDLKLLSGQVESQCLVLTVLRGLLKDHVSPESIAEIQHNAIEGLGELEASLVLIEQSGQ
jgi:hypothetical protein